MKINPNYIIKASKQTLSRRNYILAFIIITVTTFATFIIMPVFLIPENSLLFQLKVFTIRDYFLLAVLSALTSLLIVMQVFSYKQGKLYSAGRTAISSGSAVIAALFGTASCASCLFAVFGFLGVGTVVFLVENQMLVVGIAIILILISLYTTSVKLNRICNTCM